MPPTTKSDRYAIASDERGTWSSVDRLGSLLGSSRADSRLARFFQRTQWASAESDLDWQPTEDKTGGLA